MDLKNICRICLCIPKRSIDLFGNDEICNKIDAIASVKFVNSTELSDQICDQCLTNLNNSFNFRMLIIKSENDLQSKLETLKQTKLRTKMEHEHSVAHVDSPKALESAAKELEYAVDVNKPEAAVSVKNTTSENLPIKKSKREKKTDDDGDDFLHSIIKAVLDKDTNELNNSSSEHKESKPNMDDNTDEFHVDLKSMLAKNKFVPNNIPEKQDPKIANIDFSHLDLKSILGSTTSVPNNVPPLNKSQLKDICPNYNTKKNIKIKKRKKCAEKYM